MFLLKNVQTKPEKVDIVAGLKVPAGKVNSRPIACVTHDVFLMLQTSL